MHLVKPIQPDKSGALVRNSIQSLLQEAERTNQAFGLPVEKRSCFRVDRYQDISPQCDAVVCGTFAELPEQAEQILM